MTPKTRLPSLKCIAALICAWVFASIGIIHNRYIFNYEQYADIARHSDGLYSLAFSSLTNEEEHIRGTLKTREEEEDPSCVEWNLSSGGGRIVYHR